MFHHYYSYNNSGPLIQLLKRDDKNLEEILETESILTEAKNGNQDLLSYLLRPEIFNQLLSYVTKLPNHYTEAGFDTSQSLKGNKSTKYPYNVCELLSSDIDKIANYMLGLTNYMSIEEKQTLPDDSNYNDFEDDIIETSPNTIGTSPNSKFEEVDGLQVDNMNRNKKSNGGITEELLLPLDLLMEFMNSKVPINFTLAGYFAKILRNLFYFRPKELIEYLFGKKPCYVELMAEHIYSDSISEALSVLVKLDHQLYKDTNEHFYVNTRNKIIEKLIYNMKPQVVFERRNVSNDVDIIQKPSQPYADKDYDDDSIYQLIQNSSKLLCALIQNHKTFNASEEVLKPLLQLDTFNNFLNSIELNHHEYVGPTIQILNVITDYIIDHQESQQGQLNNTLLLHDTSPQSSSAMFSNLQNHFEIEVFISRIHEALPKLLSFLIDKEDQIIRVDSNPNLLLLPKNPSDNVMQEEEVKENILTSLTGGVATTNPNINTKSNTDIVDYRFGYCTKLFGQNRMKIVELYFSFIKMKNSMIEARLCELGFFKVLLDLLLKEEWNNILHNIILNILTFVINDNSESILRSLFENARLLDFIIQVTVEPEFVLNSKMKSRVRKGYLGHIVKLSNLIEQTKNDYIKNIKNKNEGWSIYRNQFLKKSNDNDSTKIGGNDAREIQNQFNSHYFFGNFGRNVAPENSDSNKKSEDDKNDKMEIENEDYEAHEEEEDEENDFDMEEQFNSAHLSISNNRNNDDDNYDNNEDVSDKEVSDLAIKAKMFGNENNAEYSPFQMKIKEIDSKDDVIITDNNEEASGQDLNEKDFEDAKEIEIANDQVIKAINEGQIENETIRSGNDDC